MDNPQKIFLEYRLCVTVVLMHNLSDKTFTLTVITMIKMQISDNFKDISDIINKDLLQFSCF